MVLFFAPWITDLNQLCSIAQLLRIYDRIGMSVRYSALIHILVRAGTSVTGSSDHPARLNFLVDVVP